ncbi:MAG: serine hydroxymethyltransferase [Candidatus Andersenbacteria bacterium]
MSTVGRTTDPAIEKLITAEEQRQREGIELIASENYPSKAVLSAVGSILSAKYAEGYPGKRYYAGNEVIDQIEQLAIDRAKKLFGAEHANVQPYSGSPANLAVYVGLLKPGDTLLGMSLAEGGHLTHGHTVNASGKLFAAHQYGVDPKTGLLDYDQVADLAKKVNPKLLISGATAYPRIIDYKKMQAIAQSVGAYHMVDMSHVAGLVAGGAHPNPVPHADVVTSTTHKTLRGPRGAIILCRTAVAKAIDRSVFPGLQGGPHENTIAGIAIALHEAAQPAFKKYAQQVLDNAQVLAKALAAKGFDLVTGGTDTHLILLDLTNKKMSGAEAEAALSAVGITANKNTVPGEKRSALDPSGLRLGTPAITSRGATTTHMQTIAVWISAALTQPADPTALKKIRAEVKAFAKSLPLPGLTS